MTVGENIQKYRKKLGMSQEELGKKLLVSRQTISLWEKNQTLPTIDNLMRLKEIFHVSIDEILNIDNKPDKVNKDAHEVYRFNFTQAEIKEVFQLQNKNIYKKTVMQILLLLVFAVSVISSSASDVLSALILGIFLTTFVFQLKQLFQYHKTCKQNVEQVCQSTYEYQLFEDYILINIYHNEDQISQHKCYLKDIEHICALGNWFTIQLQNQFFIIRKQALKESSVFYSYLYHHPTKIVEKKPPNKWKIISNILFVASLLSIFCAMALTFFISSITGLLFEYMWLFFCMTPIPICSVIYGYILKSKGYKYKKNIIVGFIMTFCLCMYGSFSFMF